MSILRTTNIPKSAKSFRFMSNYSVYVDNGKILIIYFHREDKIISQKSKTYGQKIYTLFPLFAEDNAEEFLQMLNALEFSKDSILTESFQKIFDADRIHPRYSKTISPAVWDLLEKKLSL